MRTKEQILSLQIVTTEEKNDKGTVTTSRFLSDREKILEVLVDIRDVLIELNNKPLEGKLFEKQVINTTNLFKPNGK